MWHIWVSELTIIGSDDWCQVIISTKAGILFMGPLGINISDISIEIETFSFKEMTFKMSSENVGHFFPATIC